ncbi:hypothetical protein HK100_010579, partial [Physocladia obscura]
MTAVSRLEKGPKSAHIPELSSETAVYDEIRLLAKFTSDADCLQWSLVLHSILLEESEVVALLRKFPEHFPEWSKALLPLSP